MHPSNKDVAHLLRSVSAAYELTGVNRFRIIAYLNASDAVEHLTQEIYDIWQSGNLANVDGIGPTITQHLEEYFRKSEGSFIEEQLQRVPATVYELMRAPGIGPKKVFAIVQAFKLHNVKTIFNDVKKAAQKNRIAELDRFGEKSQADIVNAIDIYLNRQQKEDRMALPIAFALAQKVIAYLKQNPHVERIEALGSLRRMVTSIGDIDLAVTAPTEYAADIIKHFVAYPDTVSVEGQGPTKATIILGGGKHVDLRVVEKEKFGSMLQYFTGSKMHNIKLREYALRKGSSLNEYGIKRVVSGKIEKMVQEFDSEEKFYHHLGLPWIPPEIREGTDEVIRAQKNALPDLVELDDIKGDFHVHSSFNIEPSHDLGADDFATIIQKAKELSYQYLAFSEHNPSQSGHKEKDVVDLIKKKQLALEKVAGKFTCFNSLEVDILPDGSLAIPESATEFLDLIIVAIHSSFRMNKKEMTNRILKALSFPKVKILGHPTGRLLSRREEIDADWTAIFQEAKKRNIALAIDAWPDRLDLPDSMVRQAVDNGNLLVIDSDAHAAAQMDNMFYGVSVARRGWATKNDIINAMPISYVKRWIGSK